MDTPPAIVITSGEPAGIGPELVAMMAERHRATPWGERLVVAGDRDVHAERAARIGLQPRYVEYTGADPVGFIFVTNASTVLAFEPR